MLEVIDQCKDPDQDTKTRATEPRPI